jgi:hypothetical protein
MKIGELKHLIRRTSLILCVGSLTVTITATYLYWQEKNQTIEEVKQESQSHAQDAVEQINRQLQTLKQTGQAIANDVMSGELPEDQILDKLQQTVENTEVRAAGVSYLPYAYDPYVRLYSRFYRKEGEEIKLVNIDEQYDYTDPEKGYWFNNPLNQGAGWLDIYFGESAQTWLVEYGAPFYRWNAPDADGPIGVISVNYSLEQLRELMSSFSLGKTGYAFLIDGNGTYIYHPDQDLVKDKKTIFDRAKQIKNEELKVIGEKALAGEAGLANYHNQITGQSIWVAYEPMPEKGWSIGVVFLEDELTTSAKIANRKLILISLGLVGFLSFGSAVVFRIEQGEVKNLWICSSLVSIFLASGVGFHWYLSLSERPDKTSEDTVILDKIGLESFKDLQVEESEQLNHEAPIFVPTGVFVQSIEFHDANNVYMTGYVWQKYYKGIHDGISRGFVLPEATIETEVEETYRRQEENYQLIGWYFEATLRQNFNYRKYPFDHKDIWIRLWHKDFDRNVILVPDLGAYHHMIPTSLPGIEQDFVFPGWELESSFFSYKLNTYNTNFGIDNYIGQDNFPELYFSVIAQRSFVSVFISSLMTSLVLAFLLFILQLLIGEKSKVEDTLSFSALEMVSVGGGFIFIVLLDQLSLRGTIAAGGIIYIEYFYFILYVIIMLVTINAVLLASGSESPIIKYRDNLIPKLGFWPFIMKLLLVITFVVFW